MSAAECPGPNALAALAEGRLPKDEAGRLREHVADCAPCFDTLSGTLRFLADEDAGKVRPWRAVPWLAAAAAILLAIGGLQLYRLSRPDGLRQMVAAIGGSRRLVEPRVSGFPYAPFPSPFRGPVPLDRSNPANWALFNAADRIRQDADRPGATPEDRRALGLAHLLVGDAGEAVATLEEIARSRPHDAATLSDLAAAYLVRADATHGAEDRVRAIDAARHALAIDPDRAEARFNLALALEQQVLVESSGTDVDPAPAIAAWEDYLRRDDKSPWAEEARRRLSSLRDRSAGLPAPAGPDTIERAARSADVESTKALLRTNPRVGREVFERRLLPAWGQARQEGQTAAAAEALAAAAVLARAIEGVSGDTFGSDTVRAIAEARSRTGDDASLAAALVRYAQALELYDRDETQAAAAEFRAANPVFERTACPLRWRAALCIGVADYYAGRLAEARASADGLRARAPLERYPSLLARVLWVQGLLRAVAGDLTGAQDHYGEARDLFERIGEFDGVASAEFLIGESDDLFGDYDAAWSHRARAFGLASLAAPGQRRSIHIEATHAALRQKLPWAALTFVTPLFEPWSTAEPGALTEAHHLRARILEVTGDPEGALQDLDASERALADVRDPGLRRRLEAELFSSRGAMLLARDPGAAVSTLGRAIAYFEEVGNTSRLPELYLDRGRSQRTLGAYRDAEADFARGIDLLERDQAALLARPQRVTFLDRAWTLFESILDLETGPLDDARQAFVYADRARRAELLRSPQAKAAPTEPPAPDRSVAPDEKLDADAVARAISGDQALLVLVTVPDRLLRWVFHDGRWDFRPQAISSDRVESLVSEVRRATDARDEPAFLHAMSTLYDLLLRPVEDLLPRTGVLSIVPDRRLDDVPYASLLDSADGHYVVERYATTIVPTAAMAASAAHLPPARRDAPRVLVVGSPAFDTARHPDLAPLPGAAREARRVAALYPGSLLLTGRDATASRFLARIAAADIIHFAGHAIANDRYPLLSALVMAPEPSGDPDDLLTALRLQQSAGIPARLVVLGACRAVGGGTEQAGSAFSLARPFLVAGVPAVVGAQWAVGDRPASDILSSFHVEYRRASDAASSLRAAQLAALHGPDPETRSPLAWGAFQLNGPAIPQANHLKEAS
ncbi:MAG TPA: CHAT domain-containing protein [Candidatus Polarisedimenticolia bacterium]|nr:CHAT domain-containing protein [Candidatus Polarisedimenticolia bacterium]